MSLVIPNVGEVVLLGNMLYQNPANLTLFLFKTNVTPAETDTHTTYTEADFTNYTSKTITASQTGSTWALASTSSGTTTTTYAQQSWTCGATGNTLYGYGVKNGTPTLLWVESFASPRTLASGDTLNLTLLMGLE